MHIVGLSIVGILGVIVFIRKKKTAKKTFKQRAEEVQKEIDDFRDGLSVWK